MSCIVQGKRETIRRMDDLRRLAQLKITKVAEKCLQETNGEIIELNARLAATGVVMTGGAEAQRFTIRANCYETICRTIADTWTELFIKHHKRITVDDLNFIMEQVETFAVPQTKNLAGAARLSPGGLVSAEHWAREAQAKMDQVVRHIRRDLEIRVGEDEAFPKSEEVVPVSFKTTEVHIHNSNVSNLNLGQQEMTINAALQVLSSGDSELQQVANSIKQMTEAVVADRQLQDDKKQEAVDALAAMAEDAKSGKAKVTTKAVISYFPSIISMSANLATIWNSVEPILRARLHF